MCRRNFKLYILILLIGGSTFAGGWRLGSKGYVVEVKDNLPGVVLTNREPTEPPKIEVDLATFWQAWDLLNERFVDQPLDPQKLLYGALKGLAAAVGDPYTAYLPPSENKEVLDSLNGRYEGIGAELGMRNDQLTVIAPLDGSPAESAGIKPGDKIQKVDGLPTSEMSLAEAVDKIRGPAETEVVLTLSRPAPTPEDNFAVTVRRERITVKSISWQDKGDGVVYLRVSRFGEQTAKDWDQRINEIINGVKPIKAVVLDVRSNPGGYLQASIHLASEFVNSGVIVSEEFGDRTRQELKPNHRGRLTGVPVVVLINEGSASASEILAGALRDLKGAKLVGKKSFGKGSVQDAVDFEDTSSLHITIARWLTPNGENVDGKGLAVDFEVERTEEDVDAGRDPQLEKAVEIAKAI